MEGLLRTISGHFTVMWKTHQIIILKPAEAKLRLYKSIFTQKLTGAENKLTVTKNK